MFSRLYNQRLLRNLQKYKLLSIPSISNYSSSIDPSKLTIELSKNLKPKVPNHDLLFGKNFTDHMLIIDWDKRYGWDDPKIVPYGNFEISPAASALHYALQCFEGMKAYRDDQDRIRYFRPDKNMERMNSSMKRLEMPEFDGDAFLKCQAELLKIDRHWIPKEEGYSLYIRPTAISTYPFLGVNATERIRLYSILSPVGPYYPEGFAPVSLYADHENIRAWPGGVGNKKLGGNYAPTIAPQVKAEAIGFSQILWLYGEEHYCTEVGAMNIFFVFAENGKKVIRTAPIERGDILPGVTRDSILQLVADWDQNEYEIRTEAVRMQELIDGSKDGSLLEIFGAGTAAVIAPVKSIRYMDQDINVQTGEEVGPISQKLWDQIIAIQYGKVEHPWSVIID